MSKIHKASSRTLARFQKAAAKFGGKVLRAEWEPIGPCMVFDGPTGGWDVVLSFPGRKEPYKAGAIGYNIEEVVQDIEYQGIQSREWLKRPDLTIPKATERWTQLATTLYQDVRVLMELEARATNLRDGDSKGAWELVQTLRDSDKKRLEEAQKNAVEVE